MKKKYLLIIFGLIGADCIGVLQKVSGKGASLELHEVSTYGED